MGQHRTSLKDIAARVGVSIATVSRALRDSDEVSDEMKQRIKALAKEMDYRPNPFARTLRNEDTRIIGVVVPDLVTHYYAGVLDGLEEYASQEGYSVICSNSHESHIREERNIDNFINLHVAGIIACLAQDTTDYSHYEEIYRMGIPLVFFARTCLPEMFSSVTADGDTAAYKATEQLIENGCRRIAFVGGPSHLDMVRRRKRGYLDALHDAGLDIDRALVSCGSVEYGEALRRTQALLQLPSPPDAILAFNNTVSLAAFDVVRSAGLSIPDDVALIGFTTEIWTEYVTPTFSSIADRAREQGTRTCELLLRAIKGDHNIYHEIVPMTLNLRDSSMKKKP